MLLPMQGMLIICSQARRRKIERKKKVCKCWGNPHARKQSQVLPRLVYKIKGNDT